MTTAQGYLRYPTIHGDRIVFTCEDDLWEVPAEGGVARRLTAGRAPCGFPLFSPDGSLLAFTGREDGPAEIYVMDAGGGAPRRLTHLGGLTLTAAWRPDGGAILLQSDWRQPFMGAMHLFSVSPNGGPVDRLPYGLARAISFEPEGPGVVLGINAGDPARWKRYRGGTAGRLLVDRTGEGSFAPVLKLRGNTAAPMWIGARIYFLSDHEGHGNLYSCDPSGGDLRRHTDHEDYYVRFPSTDGRRVVYQAGADLFVHDTAAGTTRRVDVALHSPRTGRARRFVEAAKHLERADLHPQGHSVACTARGAAFTMGLWEGAPVRHDPGSAVRYRLARWMPDGRRLVAVSDEHGEEEIVLFAAEGSKRPRRVRGAFGRILDLQPAPAGADRVAFANHRQELWLVDLKAGRGRRIDRSHHDRIQGFAWSPDGRWLAYGFPVSRLAWAIRLRDTQTGRTHQVTRPDFQDYGPSFDPAGRYLYFLSKRVFDPVYDGQVFDLGFPRGSRPYLVPLAATTPSPFVRATRPSRAPDAEPGKKDDAKGPPKVVVDLDGIADRVVPFPVEEGRYDAIAGAHDRVFFTALPVEGSLDQDWLTIWPPPAKARLSYFDLRTDKTDSFKDPVSGFSLSMDGKTLLLQVQRRLRVLPARVEPKDLPPKEEPSRESGWLDPGRLPLEVEPGGEWRQMFREAWRLMRDQFWTPDMSKVDWQAVHDRYLPLVDRVATRGEFSDLLWEMQGELGTSHCYELGGDYRPVPEWHQGHLGADFAWDRRRRCWKIARIVRGDSWEEKAASPLAAPGLGLREGDDLLAVDGCEVGPDRTPESCLVNRAKKAVVLTVRSRGGKPRQVTVQAMPAERLLRYRAWVEGNRAWVHAASKGRVGYLHIPDMGPVGFAEFHRYFRTEMDKEGLVVDVRWNGGGHVSPLLLEKLARRRVGYDNSRWQGVSPYPYESPVGPMVALTNEYAGSDGDMFSHCFKLFGLGPLIGRRTWGGVVGVWPRHALVDGSVTTQPEFGFWFEDVGFGIENYGTDPDIEVDILPQDHAAGRDPQLETAVKEVRKILRTHKPRMPKREERPKLTPPKLPKG